MFPDLSEIFRYELCNNPAALFEPSGMMRQAQKANLADTIWNLGDCSAADVVIQDNTRHVIDGGSLIQRIPWNKGATFGQICQMYLDYLTKRYAHPVVVFDGYSLGPSSKDHTHSRRTKGIEGTKIEFRKNTPFKSKKENFLCNNENKQAFINMLSEFLVSNGIRTEHAEADADVMIANTGIALAENYPTIIIGEDTDVLVLLLFHSSTNTTLHYKSDQSNRRANTLKVWDISKTKKLLGDQLCHVLPVIHAITGCDTTSRLFGIGKGLVLKKVMGNQDLIEIAGKVFDVDSSDVVAKFGIQLLIRMYGGFEFETLDIMRYRKFASKVVSNSVSFLQIQTLPPTTAAAEQHCKRTFYQVIEWTKRDEDLSNGKLVPVKTRLPAAPDELINVIRCKCKSNCDNRRCSC
jgi:hypothetical protein